MHCGQYGELTIAAEIRLVVESGGFEQTDGHPPATKEKGPQFRVTGSEHLGLSPPQRFAETAGMPLGLVVLLFEIVCEDELSNVVQQTDCEGIRRQLRVACFCQCNLAR